MSNRSPLFYVGDKYKLIDEIKTHFPEHIHQFVEPFVGGGSVFLNVEADNYILNDINRDVIDIHRMLCTEAVRGDEFINELLHISQEYGLSCSYICDKIPEKLKQSFPKTYFAEYDRESYSRLRDDYNKGNPRDVRLLYLLLIYGFNRMIRFNSKGNFNVPVGNVDFNSNVIDSLRFYFETVERINVQWSSLDFRVFMDGLNLTEEDLVYLDPPYLITFSEYNKIWNEESENEMLNILNDLNRHGVKFAISNVTHYKGRENTLFLRWSQNYNSHPIHSNYISYHDNTIKQFNEVLVTNF